MSALCGACWAIGGGTGEAAASGTGCGGLGADGAAARGAFDSNEEDVISALMNFGASRAAAEFIWRRREAECENYYGATHS